MEVSLYKVGNAAAIGYCAGLLSGANPAASAAFVATTSIIYGLVSEVFDNTDNRIFHRISSHGSGAICCGSAAISYKIVEKLVASIALEALGKVCLFSAVILIVSSPYKPMVRI
jgi:hypothetical protein